MKLVVGAHGHVCGFIQHIVQYRSVFRLSSQQSARQQIMLGKRRVRVVVGPRRVGLRSACKGEGRHAPAMLR